MALTPTETQQLATLAQEVTRINGTVDDLLALVRTAGQGGAVDISTHNNSAAAHGVLFDKYPVAAATVNYYLSPTGNDANDGLSAARPKGTWAGMHSLLAALDPRQYKVTVNVSGKIGGNCDLSLPRYCPENLSIVGTSATTDGFEGRLRAVAGGFTPDKISVGQLSATGKGAIKAESKTIRLTGLTAPGFGICTEAGGGQVVLQSCTIEYSGSFTILACGYGSPIYLRSNNFVAIGTPTMSMAFFGGFLGGDVLAYSNTWEGETDLTSNYCSILLHAGGTVDINNPTTMPGGGTIGRSLPGEINAKGTAVAYGYVSPEGVAGSAQGVMSCTKTATGTYTINLPSTSPSFSSGWATLRSIAGCVTTTFNITNRVVTVKTYNVTGTLVDTDFYFGVIQ